MSYSPKPDGIHLELHCSPLLATPPKHPGRIDGVQRPPALHIKVVHVPEVGKCARAFFISEDEAPDSLGAFGELVV